MRFRGVFAAVECRPCEDAGSWAVENGVAEDSRSVRERMRCINLASFRGQTKGTRGNADSGGSLG
jgi:hypothetical protein